ncbi:alpha/beta hydrolase [Bradyrhizobium sp. ARR65]|uniref:alpha/beta fold hydrolase n=1 Tax=Bradyrhizobium sp. ARR65 TaxID=1040989 RepID=UPI000464986B|nr:alpha/beta hydrolase [Bradyrhizobium sp. ARR65]
MPHIHASDGTKLYYEDVGSGSAVVFIHEFAGDHRTWEPQMRHFARSHRCITFSQRGYPPSDIPKEPASYSQDIAVGDVLAILDGLGLQRAHIVGHSMGAYTALHLGIRHPERCISVVAAGCGAGSLPEPDRCQRQRLHAVETGKMFAEQDISISAATYADGPNRQAFKNKDPRGWSEFARMLGEHSAVGHSLTMFGVQAKRPTLWEMEAELKCFVPPLLVIVGDEDEPCLEGSFFLKRTAPTAALLVAPRAGHNITSEEPAAFNAALSELFFAAESGRWLAHKPV